MFVRDEDYGHAAADFLSRRGFPGNWGEWVHGQLAACHKFNASAGARNAIPPRDWLETNARNDRAKVEAPKPEVADHGDIIRKVFEELGLPVSEIETIRTMVALHEAHCKGMEHSATDCVRQQMEDRARRDGGDLPAVTGGDPGTGPLPPESHGDGHAPFSGTV